MHDTTTFARMPASGLTAAQPRLEDILKTYAEERDVLYRDETYLVRDNGAVLRRARRDGRRRKLDECWTFGSPNKQTGYLVVGDHVVHRIVASAFHGLPPSSDHVVDHIDTNRQNNRAENLRWVTRLENVLLNPITRKRIEIAFGSLEAFFANPRAQTVPNWEWMRTVTNEEAARCLARLRKWAEEGKAPNGGRLGVWVFGPRKRSAPPSESEPVDTPSLTVGAFQRKWRTPTEFPQCPKNARTNSLDNYLEQLRVGAVFARNQYGESTVIEAGKSNDGALSVVCNTPTGIKDWTRAKIFIEGDAFCHESGGTFFTLQGALHAHRRARGEEVFEETIDDYA